jgi:PAS domain S-box-containing protein
MKSDEKTTEQLIAEVEQLRQQLKRLNASESRHKQSEAKFIGLLESAPDAIVIIDREGKIVIANGQAEKLFGYRREELIGSLLEKLVPHRVEPLHYQHRENYFKNPHTRPMGAGLNLLALRKDGVEFPVEISLSPLETEDGILITSIIRDITARKQAEEELRKAYSELRRANDELERRVEERTSELSQANKILHEQILERKRAEEQIREQAALLDKTQDAILVRDLDDNILFWNKSAEHLYGWSAAEVLEKNASELLYKAFSATYDNAQHQVLEKGEWSGELYQIRKDGKEIVVESRWTLVRDEEGKPKAKLIINTDITEKKKLAAQFLRAQRMESIGTLASGIAHDLNNALTPISMGIQILQDKFNDDESRFLLNLLAAGAERGASMVKQVLSFARGMEGEHIVLQPKNLISEIIKILKQTLPKSIVIENSVAKDLWVVNGDATQLYQVLMNLSVNARDAMPNGGKLRIEAENVYLDENYARMYLEAKPGQFVVITVTDTGSGIPSEILDKIFEPFFTTKEIGKGTGLGLSNVSAIVKSHGGFVNVYSELGSGTRFKIYLPAAEIAQSEMLGEGEIKLPAGNGELVLVVDDEFSIREITRATLEANGYEAMTAGDGTEALAIYAKNIDKIRIVIMDMMMPFLDGPATIRALFKLDPKVKIIATSGLAASEKAADAASAGVKTFLAKPYTAEKLLKLLDELLHTAIK